MSEKVNCPFCGNIVETDLYRCPKCESLFKEPELPYIKFKEFRIFIALSVLTGGLFCVLWFLINAKAINKLVVNTKDALKLNWLVLILALDLVAFCLGYIRYSAAAITVIVLIALTYRTLRIIQKYTLKTYNVLPDINPYYIGIFNVIYLVHFIDTYNDRILEVHEHLNLKLPHIIVILFLIIMFQCAYAYNPVIYNFYRWLFVIK